jgi:hypothetical protein
MAFRQTGPALPLFVQFPPFESFSLDLVGCLLALVLAVSVIVAIWTKRAIATIAIVALLVTVFCSVLKIYPFSSRLLIFLVPFAFFVIATAVDQISWNIGRAAAAACAVLLLSVAVAKDISVAFHPFSVSEMRPALEKIAPRLAAGDAIAITEMSERLYQFYAPTLIPRATQIPRAARMWEFTAGKEALIEDVRKNGYRRIWLVAAHRTYVVKGLVRELAKSAPIAFEWTGPGTRVVLFDFTSANTPP